MSGANLPEGYLPNVLVPRSVIKAPDRFGGLTERDCVRGDLLIRDGRVFGLAAPSNTIPPRMVLPKFAEPHVHLDKCHSVDRIKNVGGNLHAAIAAQFEDKTHWTNADIRARAGQGLDELIRAGCGIVRSHVDWHRGAEADIPPLAWHVLHELAQERRAEIALQLSPLIGIELLADADFADHVARTSAQAGGALGAFVFDHPKRAEGIKQAFVAADRYSIPLDFHVDEGLMPGLDGLSLIADTANEMRFQGPVLCGHCCSLMNLTADALHRLIDKVLRAGLSIVSLPTTNLYLQGREGGTPNRRGITRIAELRAAGVPVSVGTDNVRDAFCPIGRHDPLSSLASAVLAAHLDPPLGDHLPMITTDAARGMGFAPVFVDDAAAADLQIFDVGSTSALLADAPPPQPVSSPLLGDTS
ncbi:MAG: amidohydrolase family protein [Sulfitobacter sp.]